MEGNLVWVLHIGTWLVGIYICQFLCMCDLFYLKKEGDAFEALCMCVCKIIG
jgi:hypothetical protein